MSGSMLASGHRRQQESCKGSPLEGGLASETNPKHIVLGRDNTRNNDIFKATISVCAIFHFCPSTLCGSTSVVNTTELARLSTRRHVTISSLVCGGRCQVTHRRLAESHRVSILALWRLELPEEISTNQPSHKAELKTTELELDSSQRQGLIELSYLIAPPVLRPCSFLESPPSCMSGAALEA